MINSYLVLIDPGLQPKVETHRQAETGWKPEPRWLHPATGWQQTAESTDAATTASTQAAWTTFKAESQTSSGSAAVESVGEEASILLPGSSPDRGRA